jgi:hypothetical protein
LKPFAGIDGEGLFFFGAARRRLDRFLHEVYDGDNLHKRSWAVPDYIKIVYDFRLSSGAEKKFTVLLDRKNLAFKQERTEEPPDWARLDFHQCSNCPLNTTLTKYCPIAANLGGIAQEFRELTGSDKASVTVIVKERAYFKAGSLQEGLSPLLGIAMTTSGCPIMEPLKPMVRYHLPFASLDETVFRMTSMFLMAQFIRNRAGKKPEWTLEGLSRIYGEVKKLNRDFGQRMRAAARSDANVHALVKLNVFAVMLPLETEKMLKEITPYFSSYLK